MRNGSRTPGRRWVVIAALSLAVAAVYWPVASHDFLNYDDTMYVTDNAMVQEGLTIEGVGWAFSSTHASNWHPLTWLSHMLDVQLFGLDPAGHHLVNLVYHTASAALLFLVLNGSTAALWRSALVAALFAVHPLHVESVAWVAERKDVLSAFFWFLTMALYLRYTRRREPRTYILAFLVYAAGLMSKPMLVTLPWVLLLFDFWPLGRLRIQGRESFPSRARRKTAETPGRILLEKVPFLLLAIASSIVTYVAQGAGGAIKLTAGSHLWLRFANALVSYLKYVAKTLCPAGLSVYYPYPDTSPPLWLTAGALAVLVGASVLAFRLRRRSGYLITGWFWYLVTLLPVIGIVQVGGQSMADRYSYLPVVGLFIVFAWGLTEATDGWRYRRQVLGFAAATVLVVLMIASRLQVGHWRNSVTLFEQALRSTSRNVVAHHNLANALAREGRLAEAVAHFREALRLDPTRVFSRFRLANLLAEGGKRDEAARHYREAIRTTPDFEPAYTRLGNILAAQGRDEEAAALYVEALDINPQSSDAFNLLGVSLARMGRTEEAKNRFKEALRINPRFPDAHNNLGIALAMEGRSEEAISHFMEVLRLRPDDPVARANINKALGDKKR